MSSDSDVETEAQPLVRKLDNLPGEILCLILNRLSYKEIGETRLVSIKYSSVLFEIQSILLPLV